MFTPPTSVRASPRRTVSSLSAASSNLSHAMSTIDNSKPAVIIEIGTKLTKCGFAGEFVPRAIIRTEFIDDDLTTKSGFLKDDMSDSAGMKTLSQFLKFIYHTHLLAMPRERRVVIVESPLSPSRLRKSLCKCLLDVLDVPSVIFAPSTLLASFPFYSPNVFVIDMGYKESLMMPVAEGVTMLNNWDVSGKCGRAIENRVRDLLKEHGEIENADRDCRRLNDEDMQRIEEQDLIEDICVRLLFCTNMKRAKELREKGVEASLDPPTNPVRLSLGSDFLIVSGFIREAACEVLFEENGDDEIPLHKLIYNGITKCPVDLRRNLFQSILVVGGPSLIKGFLVRLRNELTALAAERDLKCAEDLKFFKFERQNVELYANWLGGSLLGALQDVLSIRSISREEWLEKKVLPDWTDFIANPNAKVGVKSA